MSFTPYSINCSTCSARLKVRDQRAIGELSLCPKCGSMVMITPPSPGGEVTPTGVRSSGGSSPQIIVGGGIGSDFDDAASLLADTMDDVAPAKSNAEKSAVAESAVPAATGDESPTSEAAVATTQPTATAVVPQSEPPPIAPPTESMSSIDLDPSAVAVASPLAQAGAASTSSGAKPQSAMDSSFGAALPPPVSQPAWATPAQQAWQRYGLIGAACLAAVVMVSGLLFFLLRGPRDEPVAEIPTPVVPVDPIPDPEDGRNNPPEAAAPEVAPTPPTVIPEGEEPVEDVPPPEVAPDTTPEPADPPTDAPPLFADDDPDGTIDKPLNEPTADTGLGELAPLIDAFPLPPIAPPTRRVDEPSELPAPIPTATASRPRPDPVNVNVTQRMADSLAGIDTQGAPLVKVVELITQISTVPITLSPEALAQRKTSPNVAISVVLEETTVGTALKAVLASRGLAPVVHDDQIVVVSAASLGGQRIVEHAVDDLVDEEVSAKALAAQIKTLIAPQSWKAEEGEAAIDITANKLKITNSFDVQFRIHVLLNKLRVARGQKPRSSFDPTVFAVASRSQRVQAKLDQPIRAVFHVEQPLTKVLAHLEKAAGVTFLIDWQALLEAGWPPHSTAAVVADDVPLSTALDELLGPMDLTYRAIDATTLQITSVQALTSAAEFEVYPVAEVLAAKKAAPPKLIDDLQKQLGPGLFVAGGGEFAMLYDEPSQSLLVRLPQAQQRVVERIVTPASH